MSFAVRAAAGNTNEVSSVAALLSILAVGVSLTSETLILTVAALDSAVPSLVLKVKLSVPK